MREGAEARQVRDLAKGDIILFGPTTGRTVEYCVESDIDPVYLIGFAFGEPQQIAKAPDDWVFVST